MGVEGTGNRSERVAEVGGAGGKRGRWSRGKRAEDIEAGSLLTIFQSKRCVFNIASLNVSHRCWPRA